MSGNGTPGGQISSSQSASIGGLGSSLPSAAGMQQAMNPQQLQHQQHQQNGAMAQQQRVVNQPRMMVQRGRPPGGVNVYSQQQMTSMQQQMQRLHANANQMANQVTSQMAGAQSPQLHQQQQQPRLMSPAAGAVTAVRSTIFTSASPGGLQYVQQPQGMRPAIVPPMQQVRARAQSPSMVGFQGVRSAGMMPRPQQQQQMQRAQGSPVTRAPSPGYPQQQQQLQQWSRPPAIQPQQQQQQATGAQQTRPLTAQQQQFLLQQQQARAQQRPATPTSQQPEPTNRILGKRSIQELVAQVDSREKLDPEVEDALLEIADDFIESVTTFACALAKHRNSTVLEARDVLFHLERNWDMTLPGFGNEYKPNKRAALSEPHKQRLAVVRKS